MAAGILPKPGSEYGPCEASCEHKDCAQTRLTAAKPCHVCGKEIGYEKPYYCINQHSGLYAHADCYEDSIYASKNWAEKES